MKLCAIMACDGYGTAEHPVLINPKHVAAIIPIQLGLGKSAEMGHQIYISGCNDALIFTTWGMDQLQSLLETDDA